MTDLMVGISILSVFITAFFTYLIARLNVSQQRKLVATDVGTKKIGWRDDYIEYSSPAAIADAWFAPNKDGEKCNMCSMSDKACVDSRINYFVIRTCVWCAELNSLTAHLKIRGTRNNTSLVHLKHQ